MRITVCLAVVLGLGAQIAIAAPFAITPTTDPNQLVSQLLGPGVTLVGTPVYSGQSGQAGVFTEFTSGPYTNPVTGVSGQVSIPAGIVLSSGNVADATGAFVTGANTDVGGGSDADLAALLGGGVQVFDAASLTFSFVSTISQTLTFTFAFASTEYPNFVNDQFNDAFAFLLNGQNIALVPGTTDPISINTVNVGTSPGGNAADATNPQYFTQYSAAGVTPFNYGGLTTLFTVQAPLQPGTNTIKFVVGDVADAVLDSAVFIQAGTFSTTPPNGEIPEPSTYLMLAGGLGLLAWSARRRRAIR